MDSYRVRRTLFETESAFAVDGGALTRTDAKGAAERLELNAVRRVVLSYQPLNRVDRWVCSVEAPGGRIWLPSASFTGPGQTEDRRIAFRAFVQDLHQAIVRQPNVANIRFVQGSALAAYSALATLILFAILAVLLVLGFVGSLMSHEGGSSRGWVLFPILLVVTSGGLVGRIWRRNRPGVYDPAALPATFAPPN